MVKCNVCSREKEIEEMKINIAVAQSDIQNVKNDINGIRGDVKDIRNDVKEIKNTMSRNTTYIISLLITAIGTLLTILFKGWLL